MGYSYSASGALVCDECGKTGGVRKRPCPFGYCYPPALCGPCNTETGASRKARHVGLGCEKGHAEHVAREARRRALLEGGAALRCSARGETGPDGRYRVHVLFRKADGSTVGRYMGKETYDAIPLLVDATPEDFAKLGAVTDAPAAFTWARAGAGAR